MGLTAELRVPGRLQAHVTASDGEVVAVVGPNGAGKSTLLSALAGTVRASGTVLVDGVESIDLPPERRRIGWMPQAGLLFPHLSALGNVAFGLRAAGATRRHARGAALAWLTRLDVQHLANCRPGALSGGEAARVALARALAPEPRLLLLDEPFAALDAATRVDVRRLLREHLSQGRTPVLLVTHDPVDAIAVADRVLVLEQGRVVQDGTVRAVVDAPRSPWVAGLLGLNAWRGRVREGLVHVDGGGTVVAAEPGRSGRDVLALVLPAAVALHRTPPGGSPRNVLAGAVTSTTLLAGRVRVTIDSAPPVIAEVTAAAADQLRLADGGRIWATVKATEVQLVDV